MTININLGVCNVSTVGFMFFLIFRGYPPRATPEGGGGDFFWDGRGVVHDYTYKVWSLYLDYFYFSWVILLRVERGRGGGETLLE